MENKVKLYAVLNENGDIVGTGETAICAWQSATDDHETLNNIWNLEGDGWTCRCLVGEWKDAE